MATETLRIALTPGEPAGIGPDLTVALAQRPLPAEIVAVADPALLAERARRLGCTLELVEFDPAAPPAPQRPGRITVLPVHRAAATRCGSPVPTNANYVLATLRRAVQGCRAREFAALVTGPVHKGVISEAGIPFSGHTEYLAELCAGPEVVMMLATPGLRVALATTHLPLRAVPEALTAARLEAVVRITDAGLRRWFGLGAPRLAVCGLNPHAGEGGHLGREETQIIEPVLARLRSAGLQLAGPLPADTVFLPERLAATDAVIAMYHDQGLPVLKHLGFGKAVNITLGLPIIRTSVDHGTALDLAGSGKADGGSLEYALQTALAMAGSAAREAAAAGPARR